MHLSSYNIERLQAIKALIDSNLMRHYTIPELAKHAGMSETNLKARFKEFFGKGLYHYLLQQRFIKAVYLLEETDMTLKEISRKLGYKFTCNFITAFKKKYGKPPIKYKRNK